MARLRHHPGGRRTGHVRASQFVHQELRHGLRLQGLPRQTRHDQLHPQHLTGPRQGVDSVSPERRKPLCSVRAMSPGQLAIP